MRLARVTATVVSTIRHPFFEGRKLLLCHYAGPDGAVSGGYTIAVDTVEAGVGDLVLIVDEGNGARQITGTTNTPIRAVIAGIVDEVSLA